MWVLTPDACAQSLLGFSVILTAVVSAVVVITCVLLVTKSINSELIAGKMILNEISEDVQNTFPPSILDNLLITNVGWGS